MSIQKFKELHQQGEPLILANVWDAHSAQLAEKAGIKAVGTSSHAISNAMGKEDGNNLTFEELYRTVAYVLNVVKVPVSVDIESGYSKDPEVVAEHILHLARMGVVGVNLEDSVTDEQGKRTLEDGEVFADKLRSIVRNLRENDAAVFINLRTDTYVTRHPEALQETIRRAKLYEAAGADGLFVPLILKEADVREVLSATSLALNVFAVKDGPTYEDWKNWGVHRISSGDAAYASTMRHVSGIYQKLAENQDLAALYD